MMKLSSVALLLVAGVVLAGCSMATPEPAVEETMMEAPTEEVMMDGAAEEVMVEETETEVMAE